MRRKYIIILKGVFYWRIQDFSGGGGHIVQSTIEDKRGVLKLGCVAHAQKTVYNTFFGQERGTLCPSFLRGTTTVIKDEERKG